jgi:hypothetical protein
MYQDFTIVQATDTTKSGAVQVPQWARYGALYIPAVANGIISLEIMEDRNQTAAKLIADQDTDWITLRDEGESSQVAASGVESCWIDISEFIKALPKDCWIRVVSAAAQTGTITFTISFRGN